MVERAGTSETAGGETPVAKVYLAPGRYQELLEKERILSGLQNAPLWGLVSHLTRTCKGCSRRMQRLLTGIAEFRSKLK